MAAYAALISLMNTTEQIMDHPRLSITFDEEQIKSLLENIVFLQEFMDNHSHGLTKEEAEILESQITSAAHAAEDAIESHVVDQILEGSDENGSVFLLEEGLIDDIDTIKKKVVNVKNAGGFKGMQPYSILASSSRYLTIEKSSMVGFDDYLIQLMDKLTGLQANQHVIPIVGMGGIGKTTLARNVFEKALIMQFFDIRAWATVSQNYSVRDLLLELLSSIVENRDKFIAFEEHQLGEELYKRLWGRRYLIILDDIWDFKAWEKINLYFPNKGNGSDSRIVVTTRLMGVALEFGYSYLTINLLDEDQSWNLLCKRAFGQQDCPTELEKVGKKIAENCKGLPLSIVVIGGFLRRSNMSPEFWESVANDTNSILNSGGEEQCLDILSLSYFHLPAHLKPCFLYMGVFPEDEKIRVSRLVKLWVAEGFIKPNEIQSLEEVGESYLKDLVDRNLILVHSWGSNGKIKDCNFHDLLRELCLKIAEKEHFLCVMKLLDTSLATDKERCIVVHESVFGNKAFSMGSAPLVRSLVCRGNWRWRFNFRLLRVLNTIDEGFVESDSMCVNLRCIDRRFVWFMDDKVTSTGWHLPSLYGPKRISVFWNLQIISIKGCSKQEFALSEIWEMPQLRHIKVDIFKLHNPPQSDKIVLVLQNLQTLSTIENFRLTEEVCRRIPNIKKLHLQYNDLRMECEVSSYYCPHNLGRFHKLESLECQFSVDSSCRDFVLNFKFPSSLKKLSLINCHLYWEDLTMVGSLPHLEVFKLGGRSVLGPEWNPIEGQFLRLKSLKIHYYCDLIDWNADSCHFPVLENLLLRGLSKLNEIPSGIGEIPTLRFIRLKYCSLSAAVSAVKILEEQQNLGNEGLQLEVKFWDEWELGIFEDEVQLGSVRRKNIRLVVRS